MSKKNTIPAPSEPTIGATPRVAGATVPTTAKAEKPPKVEKPKVERDKKNGVTRPAPGTTTGKVWEIADKISEKLGSPATREQVAKALGDSMNSSTVATQYGKWRRYYGLPRIRKVTEEAPAAADTSPEAPAQEATEAPKDEAETTVEEDDGVQTA